MPKYNLMSNFRVLNFCFDEPVDSTRRQKIKCDKTGETSVILRSDVDILLDQQSFIKNNPGIARQYLNNIQLPRDSAISSEVSKMSDTALLATTMPRHVSAMSDVVNWIYYNAQRIRETRRRAGDKLWDANADALSKTTKKE